MGNLTFKTSKKKKTWNFPGFLLPRIISDRSDIRKHFLQFLILRNKIDLCWRAFSMEQQPALSVLTVETLPVHRLHCGKFPGNAIAGFEIYMYEPSTRSRDVYIYVYIRKQWHNRDGCITIEKRHVIKCCPKVIDMEMNGKMWKIVVDVLQVSSLDSRNREKHIILNGIKYWSEYFLKRQIIM